MVSKISFGALPPKAQYISENLIIGARQGMADLHQLRNEEYVTRVIDLRNARYLRRVKEFIICKLLGLQYLSQPMVIGDKAPLSINKFEKIHLLIQGNTTGRTYIHCNNGRHRSMLVAAFEKIKSGAITSFDDFTKFLKDGNYYKLKKKVRYGFRIPLTPEDIKYRTENLDYQRKAFWNMVNC